MFTLSIVIIAGTSVKNRRGDFPCQGEVTLICVFLPDGKQVEKQNILWSQHMQTHVPFCPSISFKSKMSNSLPMSLGGMYNADR